MGGALPLGGGRGGCRPAWPGRAGAGDVSAAAPGRGGGGPVRGATRRTASVARTPRRGLRGFLRATSRAEEETAARRPGRPGAPQGREVRPGAEVLLQGFHWTSHAQGGKDGGGWYATLGAKAAAIAAVGITDVWMPPPCHSVSPEGYLPGRLYDLSTEYGTRADLEAALDALHAVGLRALADVVLNHRCADGQDETGAWTQYSNVSFPRVLADEEEGGPDGAKHATNWGRWAITCDDPVFPGRGGPDTGDDFAGAPDLDHLNPELRAALTDWLRWLRDEIHFDAWRLDFARGYGGQFAAEYVAATVRTEALAVAEYWADAAWGGGGELEYDQDRMRQAMCDWLDVAGVGNRTACFDFATKVRAASARCGGAVRVRRAPGLTLAPSKAVLQHAVATGEFWRLSDAQRKPPGLIGWWPDRAVTFIENHDTGPECGGQAHWPFADGKMLLGYAYIATHPGHPCIYWPHLFGCAGEGDAPNGPAVEALLRARKAAGVEADSAVEILVAEQDLYFARVRPAAEAGAQGRHGLYVKIGSQFHLPADVAPDANWAVACSGQDFAVWLAGGAGDSGGSL